LQTANRTKFANPRFSKIGLNSLPCKIHCSLAVRILFDNILVMFMVNDVTWTVDTHADLFPAPHRLRKKGNLALLERDVHEWTSKWSTRGERKKWTFVKHILMVHGDGPRRRPRVDISKVHAWTLHKAPSVVPPKKGNHIFKKHQWHWWELNPSLLHGSPVPNQLDHGGQLKLWKVNVDYISAIFENSKKWTSRGPRGEFLDVIRRGPCEDLSTWALFGGALTVTLATMVVVAKSMQRPREVHFLYLKNGHFCFPAGYKLHREREPPASRRGWIPLTRFRLSG
jgi:hypothetical protein